jgi:spore germination protein YaaH
MRPLLAPALALLVPTLASAGPSRRVFGYSYAGGSSASWHWDLLTDVAFFAEPMHTDGTMPTTSWLSAGKALTDAAHAHGVRCVLAVTLFITSGQNQIHTFLSSPAAVAAGTQAIVDAVTANDADGASLDFEFVSSGDRAAFTAFVVGLADALHTARPGSDLSIAMPAVTYPGYDIAALGAAADTLMVMAYDFHYSGSDPGPVAPLADSSLWGHGSQASAIALFQAHVDPSRVLIGMPLYGYDYHATSTAVPGQRVPGTTASAVTYRAAETDAAQYGRQWDAASSTPYYIYSDASGTRQTFYDDAESLGLKIDQVVASGVGGIGLWELSYTAPSFWTMLDGRLGGQLGPPPPDAPAAPAFDAPAARADAPVARPDAPVATGPPAGGGTGLQSSVTGGCSVGRDGSGAWLPFVLACLLVAITAPGTRRRTTRSSSRSTARRSRDRRCRRSRSWS